MHLLYGHGRQAPLVVMARHDDIIAALSHRLAEPFSWAKLGGSTYSLNMTRNSPFVEISSLLTFLLSFFPGWLPILELSYVSNSGTSKGVTGTAAGREDRGVRGLCVAWSEWVAIIAADGRWPSADPSARNSRTRQISDEAGVTRPSDVGVFSGRALHVMLTT
jgi:hypothetical protein